MLISGSGLCRGRGLRFTCLGAENTVAMALIVQHVRDQLEQVTCLFLVEGRVHVVSKCKWEE